MLHHILKYTNQHAAAHYARKKVQWDPIDMVELKAFFGILYLLGVRKAIKKALETCGVIAHKTCFQSNHVCQ